MGTRSVLRELTRDELQGLLDTSTSLSDVLRKVGLTTAGGSSRKVLNELIEGYSLDISTLEENREATFGRHGVWGKEATPLDQILVEGSTYSRCYLKKRLIAENVIPHDSCAICRQGREWNGAPLVLVLDHINGISDDNRRENLRLLCPNCNSQTRTFAGKNRANEYYCVDCSTPIKGKGKTGKCRKCVGKSQRRVKDRPSKDVLLGQVDELGYCGTGRLYGVSDNAVRKWLRSEGA